MEYQRWGRGETLYCASPSYIWSLSHLSFSSSLPSSLSLPLLSPPSLSSLHLVNNVGLSYEYPDYFLNVSEQVKKNLNTNYWPESTCMYYMYAQRRIIVVGRSASRSVCELVFRTRLASLFPTSLSLSPSLPPSLSVFIGGLYSTHAAAHFHEGCTVYQAESFAEESSSEKRRLRQFL